MHTKMRCEQVKKLLETMPKGGCEQTLRLVSDHLSRCEACRSLHAGWHKMEEVLTGSKLWLDEVARRSSISKSRIFAERATLAKRPPWRLRPVWAGAAALLLVIGVAAVFFLFDKGGHAPPTVRPPVTRIPAVTQAMAAESSSRTLLGVAEVLRRREAPSLGVPYTPRSLPRESFVPRFLRRCALESDARLGGIVQSKRDLSTPSVGPRQLFFPGLLQQSTLESDDTLGRILRSRINLTRREDT